MKIEDLFEVSKNNEINIKGVCRTLPLFKDIYNNDKGVEVNGFRTKPIAERQLAYIYFTINKDFYNNYSEKERDSVIRKRIGINKDEIEDLYVQRAIAELKEDLKLVEEKLLDVLEENLHGQIALFKEIGKSNQAALIFLTDTTIEDQFTNKIKERNEILTGVKEDHILFLRNIKDFSLAIAEVDKLRAQKDNKKRLEGKDENRLETDALFYAKKPKIF